MSIKDQVSCWILRSGVIYGPGGTLYPPRLGFSMGAKKYLIIGDGDNRIPFVYVGNLIEAIVISLQKELPSGEIFNIIDDQVLTQGDYLKSLQGEINPSLKIVKVSYGF